VDDVEIRGSIASRKAAASDLIIVVRNEHDVIEGDLGG
jgi:hypothetical protein